MNRKTQLLLSFILLLNSGYAQTYFGSTGLVSDEGAITDFTLEINDLSPDSLNQQHGLTRVCLNITHTWVSDLDIRLITPAGENIMLTAAMGGDSDNYDTTCFYMNADLHILKGWGPYTGDFRPFTPLGNANNNKSGNGTWILRILDVYAYADQGEVLGWSLTFGEDAPVPASHEGTTLPIIELTTENNITIPNEPKIPGRMKVIFDDTGNLNHFGDSAMFECRIGIEVRGASSQGFPKKSFGFETQDEDGVDLETELLGMPKEEDWILYAPYTDKTFIRDALTYKLGNDLGRYAPRTSFVELYLNGDYHGVYCLEEKIKRDKNRLNIEKLNPADTIGDPLTGGYILKVDRDDGPGTYFASNQDGTYPDEEIRIVYEDPDGPDLHPKQQEYIQNFFHAFEAALYGEDFKDPLLGYRRYVDVSSLVDYFIVNEFGHNVDAYRLSTFFYKDRNSLDSLFHLGPLWDFNLAFGNVDYCNSQNVEGWAYEDSGGCGNTPRWWARLQEDPNFQDRVRCRYDSLRQTVLSTEALVDYMETYPDQFADASDRNYDRWPILGMYIWPNNFIGETYQEELNYMKLWIIGRLEWLDANLQGECLPPSAVNGLEESGMVLSPNPTSYSFIIRSNGTQAETGVLKIRNVSGITCLTWTNVSLNEEIEISSLLAGVYYVSLEMTNGRVYKQKLVVLE